jgi:hypothetical protein
MARRWEKGATLPGSRRILPTGVMLSWEKTERNIQWFYVDSLRVGNFLLIGFHLVPN